SFIGPFSRVFCQTFDLARAAHLSGCMGLVSPAVEVSTAFGFLSQTFFFFFRLSLGNLTFFLHLPFSDLTFFLRLLFSNRPFFLGLSSVRFGLFLLGILCSNPAGC